MPAGPGCQPDSQEGSTFLKFDIMNDNVVKMIPKTIISNKSSSQVARHFRKLKAIYAEIYLISADSAKTVKGCRKKKRQGRIIAATDNL